jgi:hypothetical protein
VEEKREYIPGEPLKRPEHIYYTKGELYKRQFFKHNISTGEIEEVRFGDLSRDELDILQNSNRGYRQTLEYTGDSQLRLYNNYWSYILRLNESMTEIVSVTEQKKKPPSATFLIPINEDKYIGLNSTTWPYPGDDVDYYYILFLDKNGRRQKEYKEIAVVHNDGYRDDTSLAGLCLVSPDRQYVLLFNSNSSVDKEGYVYKIIYLSVGILNDDRVRVRAEPNLTGATLGVVNRVDKVEILETGQEKQKIGDMESVWYKIRTDAGVEGWVFGAYVDMVDMIGTN